MTPTEAAEELEGDELVDFLAGYDWQGTPEAADREEWSEAIERDHEGTTLELADLYVSGRISASVYERVYERLTS